MTWRGNNLDAGAMMALLSAAFGIVAGIVILLGWQRYGTFEHMTGIIVLAISILTIWGTRRYVLPGRNYPLAILFGGVCAVLCGALFGIVALVLISISKKEF